MWRMCFWERIRHTGPNCLQKRQARPAPDLAWTSVLYSPLHFISFLLFTIVYLTKSYLPKTPSLGQKMGHKSRHLAVCSSGCSLTAIKYILNTPIWTCLTSAFKQWFLCHPLLNQKLTVFYMLIKSLLNPLFDKPSRSNHFDSMQEQWVDTRWFPLPPAPYAALVREPCVRNLVKSLVCEGVKLCETLQWGQVQQPFPRF